MTWEQYIDTYLFSDNYGTYLVDFLENYLSGYSDLDKVIHFFAMYDKWKSEYLICSKTFSIDGFYAWYTDIGFFKFSLPSDKAHDAEDWIEKAALLSMEFECDKNGEIKKEYYYQNCYPPYEVFKEEFDALNYAKEKCAKLTSSEVVDELQNIYHLSMDKFQSRTKKGINITKNNYSIFHSIIHFFEALQDETVIRLNDSAENAYLWYLVKTNSDFYILRISDFV